MKTYIGVDISKKSFVAAFPKDKNYSRFKTVEYTNDAKGVAAFIAALPIDAHCILEATGNYSLLLSYSLVGAKVHVSVINPKSFKHFFLMIGQTQKTDNQDAQTLALFGERMEPKLFVPKSKNLLKIKQLCSVLNQFKKQKVSLKNNLEALTVHPQQSELAMQAVTEMLVHLEQTIDKVQAEISQISKQDFKKCYDLLLTIPAIGERLATALILATSGFQSFDNAKQFAKFVGLAPTHYQSGSSLNVRGQINRSGDPQLRGLLYMCSMVAIRHNPICKEFYQRLKNNGKPSMVALMAVCNKLIKLAFGVIKSGEPFDADFGGSKKAV